MAGKKKTKLKDLIPDLGDEVQDPISKMKGIVVSRTEFLNGCLRVGVQKIDKKVTDTDNVYFDINQLKVTKVGVFEVRGERLIKQPDEEPKRGGFQPHETRGNSAK